MSNENPYAPPQTEVGAVEVSAVGTLRDSPQRVPAGHGWRWFADAYALFKRSPLIWIVNIVLYVLAMLLVLVVPIVGGLLQMLLAPVLSGGLMRGASAVDHGRELKVSHLFAGFQTRPGALLSLGLLSLVASLVAMMVSGMISGVGMETLMTLSLGGAGAADPAQIQEILPLLLLASSIMMLLMIPAMMLLWFAPALIVLNEDVGVVDAMKQSFVACLKNVLPFLLYGLVGLMFSILATVLLGLGWFVLLPTIIASIYVAYKDIFIE